MRAPSIYISGDETSLCFGFEREYKLVLEVGGADWKNVGNAAVLAGNSSVMTEKSNTDRGRFQTEKDNTVLKCM